MRSPTPGGGAGKTQDSNLVPLHIDFEILLIVLDNLLSCLGGKFQAETVGTDLLGCIGQRNLFLKGVTIDGDGTSRDKVSPPGKVERDLFSLEAVCLEGKEVPISLGV